MTAKQRLLGARVEWLHRHEGQEYAGSRIIGWGINDNGTGRFLLADSREVEVPFPPRLRETERTAALARYDAARETR